MIVHNAEKKSRELHPGILHTVLSYTDQLMLCEVSLARGSSMPQHAHPHTQIIYVVRGCLEVLCERGSERLEAGESCALAPHESHGVIALEDSLVIDAFCPARADFVATAGT